VPSGARGAGRAGTTTGEYGRPCKAGRFRAAPRRRMGAPPSLCKTIKKAGFLVREPGLRWRTLLALPPSDCLPEAKHQPTDQRLTNASACLRRRIRSDARFLDWAAWRTSKKKRRS